MRGSGAKRRKLLVALGIAFGYVSLQAIVGGTARFYEWDEAIYLAEVAPGIETIGFAAHRARGITLAVLPVAQFTTEPWAVRSYLMGLSAASTALAYVAWTAQLTRKEVALSAGLFASSWVALFYGGEISPNLYVAILAVALVGLVESRDPFGARRRMTTGMVTVLAALLVTFRPFDAALVLGSVTLTVVFFDRRKQSLWKLLPLVAGGVLGFSIWAAESVVRFGGVLPRLESAARIVEATDRFAAMEHLKLLDGPLIGPDPHPTVSVLGASWLAVLLISAAAGLILTKGRLRRALVLAFVPGALLFLAYGTIVGTLAPRFLLPAYGLIAVPAGVGIAELWSMKGFRWSRVAIVPLFAVFVTWHVSVARSVAEEQRTTRADARELGEVLEVVSEGYACQFVSQYGYPQIALASGCRGQRLDVGSALMTASELSAQRSPSERVFVISLQNLELEQRRDWREEGLSIGTDVWYLYWPEEQAVPPDEVPATPTAS